ncbi:hypothetical protein D3C72_1027940 [compost metagenome]
MKIYPSSTYIFKLIDGEKESLERLERRTEISASLASQKTEKSFIGTVSGSEFRIISSEIGIGSLCILSGNIENQLGQVTIEINKAFKVLFSILLILPFIPLISEYIKNPSDFPRILILVVIFQLFIIRFLMIELFFFRFVSKRSLNRLRDVLDAELVD